MMFIHFIRLIAHLTREALESRSIERSFIRSLYADYQIVPDIESFLTRASRLFPKLNCGIASLCLKTFIRKGCIIRGQYENNNHTFLFIDRTLIVDITADQFGGPRVYVGPAQPPWFV